MGCYRFKDLKKLGIFGKSAYKKVSASSGAAVNQCLQMACENDYEIIGIQKIGRNHFLPERERKTMEPERRNTESKEM